MSSGPRDFIYGLVDPHTLMIRYVGLSSTGMRRPRSHKRRSQQGTRSHSSNWIQGLIANGAMYSIVVLEEVHRDRLPDTERWWIAYGRASGWPLTNLTAGGQSAKHTAREKISASLMGRAVSSATRAKMSASAAIRWSQPEDLEAARNRALVQFGSPEARAAISARIAAMPRAEWLAHQAKMTAAASTPEARKRSIENSNAAKRTPEFRAKASARTRERMADPAERAKISAATKAAMASPEIRARISAKGIGRKRSPETRAKIAATLRARQRPAAM